MGNFARFLKKPVAFSALSCRAASCLRDDEVGVLQKCVCNSRSRLAYRKRVSLSRVCAQPHDWKVFAENDAKVEKSVCRRGLVGVTRELLGKKRRHDPLAVR